MIWYTCTSWNDYHNQVVLGLCTMEYYCENDITLIKSLAEHQANSKYSINKSCNSYYYFRRSNPVSCDGWSGTQWYSTTAVLWVSGWTHQLWHTQGSWLPQSPGGPCWRFLFGDSLICFLFSQESQYLDCYRQNDMLLFEVHWIYILKLLTG